MKITISFGKREEKGKVGQSPESQVLLSSRICPVSSRRRWVVTMLALLVNDLERARLGFLV